MDSNETVIRDREILFLKAQKIRRRGLCAESFESFCRKVWQDKIENIGADDFKRILTLVWGEK